ncbi:hypothetical protein D3C85_1805850 [compost metagenome]
MSSTSSTRMPARRPDSGVWAGSADCWAEPVRTAVTVESRRDGVVGLARMVAMCRLSAMGINSSV